MRNSIIAALIVLVASAAAFGQAKDLTDLVGSRAAGGETELEKRGYTNTGGSKDDTSSWTYWWNSKNKKCVTVRTEDGKYASITDTVPPDCGHKTGLSSGDKAAIAVGAAAAAIGVAAIVHKAHDHKDGRHWEDERWESEYDRGYRDGLYNNTYHDWNNTDQYRDGYKDGSKQRRREIPYSSGWGGNQPHVYLLDLIGVRGSAAESTIRSRGFRNVNTMKLGDASYQIWYSGNTNQCVRVIVIDGKYDSIHDTNSPYCR
jgi:hypothetical protein